MHDDFPIGPTGEYPEGKLNEDDKGELRIAIGHQEGNVIMEFGVPTRRTSFPPGTARRVAAAMMNHAHAIDGKGPTNTIAD